MGSSLPSPSALPRVSACVFSETLPHVQSTSSHAVAGTVAHRFLQRCLEVGRDAALGEAPMEHVPALERFDVAQLPASSPDQYVGEVSFAFNPWTEDSIELGRGLDRAQARAVARERELDPETWEIGTVDVESIDGDCSIIIDYKTGYGHVDRAAENWQAWTYALMVCRARGTRRARLGICRTRDDGDVYWDMVEADFLDLDAHAAELRKLLELRRLAIDGKLPRLEPAEGEHCRYCPALHSCPAKTRMLVAITSPAMSLDGRTPSSQLEHQIFPLTAESAKDAWVKLKVAEKLIDRYLKSIKEYARAYPVDLGDGYVLGEREVADETIVPSKARTVLEERFGELGSLVYAEAADTEVSMTKKALKTALQKLVLPTLPERERKITWLVNDVEEALRVSRAMDVTHKRRVDEHKDSGDNVRALETVVAKASA